MREKEDAAAAVEGWRLSILSMLICHVMVMSLVTLNSMAGGVKMQRVEVMSTMVVLQGRRGRRTWRESKKIIRKEAPMKRVGGRGELRRQWDRGEKTKGK